MKNKSYSYIFPVSGKVSFRQATHLQVKLNGEWGALRGDDYLSSVVTAAAVWYTQWHSHFSPPKNEIY